MASKGVSYTSDMDTHSKIYADAKSIVREALDSLAGKDDKVVSNAIKRKFDEKYGPTWHVIVGEDFKSSITHESKTMFFISSGKSNVLLYRCG